MRTTVLAAVAAVSLAVLSGCGSSTPPAGEPDAAKACASSGTQAASLASQAAALNPRYATLAADEQADAASEATTQDELSDGSSGDDSGLGALAGSESMGTGGGIKVISDCVSLGLPVTHH
jgi:hypothetical protein